MGTDRCLGILSVVPIAGEWPLLGKTTILRKIGRRVRKNLVVVRAGDKSLHPQWLSNTERNWDLVVSYYGDRPSRYEGQFDEIDVCRGSKWEGLASYFSRHMESVRQYQYVWLPDDDLFTTTENINCFFDACEQLDLLLAQPALTRNSYYSWPITLQQANSVCRLTDFVEIMAPCFAVEHLGRFVDTFALNSSGWGLEWVWAAIAQELGAHKMGIVDYAPLFHTRKVGAAGHGGTQGSPREQAASLLEQYSINRTPPKVLAVIREVASLEGIYSPDNIWFASKDGKQKKSASRWRRIFRRGSR